MVNFGLLFVNIWSLCSQAKTQWNQTLSNGMACCILKGSFRRLRQTHAFSADICGKIEKILISKKTSPENAADCGHLNEP